MLIHRITLCVLLALACAHSTYAYCSVSPRPILIPAPYSEKDIAHEYYVELASIALKLGLKESDGTQLVPTVHMNQARAIVELKKGNLDLFWTGADEQTGAQLKAIKIPLDMGLMGFRRFTISEKNRALFEQIDNLTQLKRLIACQGTYWADTKILRNAGLQVLDTPVHEDLFELLGTGRCDYFPRGFHEGPAEIARWSPIFPDLIVSNHIIIHYPFTIYFYTRETEVWLAEALERGLEMMIDQGLLLDFMKSHPSTSHLFPLQRYKEAIFIELPNPYLNKNSNIGNPRYWLTEGAFKQ